MENSEYMYHLVSIINRGVPPHKRVRLGHQVGGYRLHTDDESRDISPRLSRKNMILWLGAFITLMEYRKEE